MDEQDPIKMNEPKPQDIELLEKVSIRTYQGGESDSGESSEEDHDSHNNQVFYDTSNKLKDYEEPNPITIQLKWERGHHPTYVYRVAKKEMTLMPNSNKRANICTRIS